MITNHYKLKMTILYQRKMTIFIEHYFFADVIFFMRYKCTQVLRSNYYRTQLVVLYTNAKWYQIINT